MSLSKEKRKSWHLLQSLDKKERLAFEKYLLSQSGKRHSEELQAYHDLSQAEPGKADQAIQELFGESAQSDKYLRAIHSRFSKKLKEFLAIDALKHSPMKDIMLLEALEDREPSQLFRAAQNKIERELDRKTARSEAYFQKKFLLKSIQQNHLIKYRTKGEELPFSEALEAFDLWWIHRKISLACYAREQKNLRTTPSTSLLLDELIQKIKEEPFFSKHIALKIYVKYYEFLEEEKPEEMPALENEIKQNIHLFDAEERHNFFTLIYNFYARIYKKDRTAILANKVIEHFEWGVDKKVLYGGRMISWDYYRNVMHLCLQHKFLDQAKTYLVAWKDKLRKKDRKELIPYFRGLISFQDRQWGSAKRELNILFKHPLIKIPAAFVFLQALYEEESEIDISLFRRKLNSIKNYINKSNHPRVINSKYQHLSRYEYFRQLINANSNSELEVLSNRLQGPEQFPEKTWIQEKVEEKLVKKTGPASESDG